MSDGPLEKVSPIIQFASWFWGVFERPLTLILLLDSRVSRYKWEACRDTKWWCVLLSAERRAYFCKSIAIEMGGVSRYSSGVSVSGVDLTLLRFWGLLLG